MQPQAGHDVTGLLLAWRGGDRRALEGLIPLLDKELHRIAKHYMAAQPVGHTLQTTALVNEAYLRLKEKDLVPLASALNATSACCGFGLSLNHTITERGKTSCKRTAISTAAHSASSNPSPRNTSKGLRIFIVFSSLICIIARNPVRHFRVT